MEKLRILWQASVLFESHITDSDGLAEKQIPLYLNPLITDKL